VHELPKLVCKQYSDVKEKHDAIIFLQKLYTTGVLVTAVDNSYLMDIDDFVWLEKFSFVTLVTWCMQIGVDGKIL